ncbi:class I SAM-dependent DNA methyltransferase [Methylovulum miyakonense]|uniref:class I SAM-dependent DNA methyltransferase n=1 Tax=Methylovulum miyakonense TaxID=645578 RepID=UPI00037F41AE|nr:class I SAM-dependent DNA methyltransferase [Methylovulum miyakonense]
MNISSTIKSIQDIMRKDDGVDGDAQRIGQLTWMLFLKVFDQREEEWEDDNSAYQSPIPERFRWRNWAAYKADSEGKKKPQIQGSELTPFINNELFPALKDIDASDSPTQKVIKQVFEDSNNYMKNGSLMLAVIEKLEDAINFHDFKTRAHLGDVYEQLLNDLRGAGNAGEFYTPRAITQFMVERINPNLAKRETVMDPACGTGGFLTAAIDHFRHQLSDKSSADDKRAIEQLIHGIEKKQLPHLLCTTNMLLHGIDVPSQIDHSNTLGRPWNDWRADEKVACLITNPPFGGYEDDGVGIDYPSDLKTRETADMFMALIIKKLLKDDGGRGAVVLPDGTMFGDGIKGKLKELLLRECNLHTVIRLPKGVFAPYTTIKTNLLFFTKGKPTETIWFYEHPYPAGYKSYSKTKPIDYREFKAEQDWWGNEENGFAERVESENAWKIDFKTKKLEAEAAAKPHWDKAEQLNNQAAALDNQSKDLKSSLTGVTDAVQRKQVDEQILVLREQADTLRLAARDAQTAGDRLYWPIYNLDIKNPNAAADEIHDPDVLLQKYKELLGQIEDTQNQLKGELAAALAHHFSTEAEA